MNANMEKRHHQVNLKQHAHVNNNNLNMIPSKMTCVLKNIMNNPCLKNKNNSKKRTSMLKDEHMRAAPPKNFINNNNNNVHNPKSCDKMNYAASIVTHNYIDNQLFHQNQKLISVVGSKNRLFNKDMIMSSSRRTVTLCLKMDEPRIGFKDKML